MSSNYWNDQYEKEVLAGRINRHIAKKFVERYADPDADLTPIVLEIKDFYKKMKPSEPKYKSYLSLQLQPDGYYKPTVEIP